MESNNKSMKSASIERKNDGKTKCATIKHDKKSSEKTNK